MSQFNSTELRGILREMISKSNTEIRAIVSSAIFSTGKSNAVATISSQMKFINSAINETLSTSTSSRENLLDLKNSKQTPADYLDLPSLYLFYDFQQQLIKNFYLTNIKQTFSNNNHTSITSQVEDVADTFWKTISKKYGIKSVEYTNTKCPKYTEEKIIKLFYSHHPEIPTSSFAKKTVYRKATEDCYSQKESILQQVADNKLEVADKKSKLFVEQLTREREKSHDEFLKYAKKEGLDKKLSGLSGMEYADAIIAHITGGGNTDVTDNGKKLIDVKYNSDNDEKKDDNKLDTRNKSLLTKVYYNENGEEVKREPVYYSDDSKNNTDDNELTENLSEDVLKDEDEKGDAELVGLDEQGTPISRHNGKFTRPDGICHNGNIYPLDESYSSSISTNPFDKE